MEKEKNMELLLQALTAVGFPASIEWDLRVQLCFTPTRFAISYAQHIQGDAVTYKIYIQHNEVINVYNPLYYEACLRKRYELPNEVIGEISLVDLDREMMLVNWSNFARLNETATVGDLAELERVSHIVASLNRLSLLPEGIRYADGMKLKYWLNTPFEHFVNRAGGSKIEQEISQRFHFYDGAPGITIEEAYRFLCHRWIERQIVQKKNADSLSLRGEQNGTVVHKRQKEQPAPKGSSKKIGEQ